MNELVKSDFIIYSSPEGNINIDVFLQGENIWLTQSLIFQDLG